MATAPSTDYHSHRSDLGRRFFLLGVFGILVAEALATIVNLGHAWIWTGTLLGVLSCVGILYLGNWLYAGDRAALAATRAWVVLQLLLVVAAMTVLLTDMPSGSPIPHRLNITASWEGWLKLVAYAGFAAAVFCPGVVLDFFAAQRGETLSETAETPTTTLAGSGEPVTLANDQAQALEGLAGMMKMASGLLAVVGALDLIVGLVTLGKAFSSGQLTAAHGSPAVTLGMVSASGLLTVVEGLALLPLGLVLAGPIQALNALLSAAPRTLGQVATLVSQLSTMFTVYISLFVALAVVIVWRLFV